MQRYVRLGLCAGLACSGLVFAASGAGAAPAITRLTPPSELFTSGNASPVIARFLPGQRFDLQATARADAGATITAFEFQVDGRPVREPAAHTSLVSGAAVSVPSGFVGSVRAFSLLRPGVHKLTVKATQSDGLVASASGNFEIVPILRGGRKVKNIIIMLGDGMGGQHRTAARIVSKGYAQGKARDLLAMDRFPVTGQVMTASLNSIVTDSAPGMSNYVNGNKGANNQEGVFPDDTTDPFDNPRIEYLSEYLHRLRGTNLGIVTTADVFDATPAANAVHTAARGNGTGIVDQYLDDRKLTGLTVLLGGGRKWFLPNPSNATSPQHPNGSQRRTTTDYVLPDDIVAAYGAARGVLDPARDLIGDFQTAGFNFAPNKAALDSASDRQPLLGLFSLSNMNVAFDKIRGRRGQSTVVNDFGFPDQPLLEEMTAKALRILDRRSPNGFILLAEGASIDKQSHAMDSDRWVDDTIEFDRAVQVARDYADRHPGTLVIVTADHECSGASIIGASLKTADELRALAAGAVHSTALQRDPVVGVFEGARFPQYTTAPDGYPATTDIDFKMLIGYGANADRFETFLASDLPAQDSQQPFVGQPPLNTYPTATNRFSTTGFFITGQVSQNGGGGQAVHTATDIPLSAAGRGAILFTGVMDNTDVFFKLGQLALGGTIAALDD